MKAFPLKAVNTFDDHEGMDLRDYFAAKAMQSLLLANMKDWPVGSDISVSKAAMKWLMP
jgi:hypothetical protein